MSGSDDSGRPDRQRDMFANRVRKNARHLRKWARRQQVSCYRLYDRDIPELPVVLDWYEGRLHAAEFVKRDAPPGRSGERWLRSLVQAAARELDVAPEDVYVKSRERQAGARQYQAQGRADHRIAVGEGGHRFWVNLVDYVDTGLFLDHRQTRRQVAEQSAGRRVLNLFCYTGSFTVYAAAAGAASTVSVDLSPRYLEWARDNLQLNQLHGDHELVRGDAMITLEQLRGDGVRFDLAVIDPPTFSNSKRTNTVFDVQADHAALLELTAAVMARPGIIYFSTNRSRFHLDQAAVEALGASVRDITATTVPMDFRDRRPHRCWRIDLG